MEFLITGKYQYAGQPAGISEIVAAASMEEAEQIAEIIFARYTARGDVVREQCIRAMGADAPAEVVIAEGDITIKLANGRLRASINGQESGWVFSPDTTSEQAFQRVKDGISFWQGLAEGEMEAQKYA